MWFKQIQIFSLTSPIKWDPQAIEQQLESFAFTPCLPHLFTSMGWVPPCGDDEFSPLVQSIPDYHMICCQFEEKILPASVIQQALHDKVKQMTAEQPSKKIPAKEKQHIKEAITQALLPRAFTKITRVFAYIDTKQQQLIVNTIHGQRTEQLMGLFQRSMEQKITALPHKKMAPIMTRWLSNNQCPRDLLIEKACLLQDPQQQHRLIRCQEQDLFADSIQALIRERCEVKQLALSWKDQVHFVLADDLSLRSLHFDDEILTAAKEEQCETAEMQFRTDFVLMTGILNSLITQLIRTFLSVDKASVPSSLEPKLEVA